MKPQSGGNFTICCDHVVYDCRAPLSNRGCPTTQRNAHRWLERSNNMAELSSDISKLCGWFSIDDELISYTVEPIYQAKLLSALRSGIMLHLTALVYYG
jgi:hypothetical protein